MDDGGRLWTVGGVRSDDLGGVDGGDIGVVGRDTSHEGGGGSRDGETHVERVGISLRGMKRIEFGYLGVFERG